MATWNMRSGFRCLGSTEEIRSMLALSAAAMFFITGFVASFDSGAVAVGVTALDIIHLLFCVRLPWIQPQWPAHARPLILLCDLRQVLPQCRRVDAHRSLRPEINARS